MTSPGRWIVTIAAVSLLDSGPASRVELIDRAVSLTPNDAFVLWGAVHICTEERDQTGCPLRAWENRLLEIDGQNSESWVRVAANRYQAGDQDKALDALRHAATSGETRAYWTESIEMIERGLAAGSDYSFPERAGMAFGFAASMLPDYGDYLSLFVCCQDAWRIGRERLSGGGGESATTAGARVSLHSLVARKPSAL